MYYIYIMQTHYANSWNNLKHSYMVQAYPQGFNTIIKPINDYIHPLTMRIPTRLRDNEVGYDTTKVDSLGMRSTYDGTQANENPFSPSPPTLDDWMSFLTPVRAHGPSASSPTSSTTIFHSPFSTPQGGPPPPDPGEGSNPFRSLSDEEKQRKIRSGIESLRNKLKRDHIATPNRAVAVAKKQQELRDLYDYRGRLK